MVPTLTFSAIASNIQKQQNWYSDLRKNVKTLNCYPKGPFPAEQPIKYLPGAGAIIES